MCYVVSLAVCAASADSPVAVRALNTPERACRGKENEDVFLRAEHFTVPPSTGPVTHVVVQNRSEEPYEGVVHLQLPDGWRWSPEEQPVALKPRETRRVPFAIEKAVDVQSNAYAVEVRVIGGGADMVRRQSVVCASAPHFDPVIDGALKEWDDALPVRFVTRGKETIVRTYWSRRAFSLAVSVEASDVKGVGVRQGTPPIDAIQFALAVRGAATGSSPADSSRRYEFLVTGGESRRSKAACFLLMTPGTPLSVAQENRPLAGLELAEARAAVKHKKGYTHYECAIPFSAMPEIRPTEGRELSFSILVHEPFGTGVRDWGEAAGLWPWQRNRLAWCSWDGVVWGEQAPFDGKIEWGLCSSIH